MKVELIEKNNNKIAHVVDDKILISNTSCAIDLMMTIKYENDIKNIAISKECIAEDFFILSSGIAGEILQKFINYQFRIAIYGDYSKYTSKPLKDFIYESNNGHNIFFVNNLEQAIDKLSKN